MSSKKILVVFGATGNQGASVVKTFLNDPSLNSEYQIRAITRDPSKPEATALIERGVEVTKADMDDLDSLRAALKNAYAVFAVTTFFEYLAEPDVKEREIQQGKNIADVSKELGIKHLIWSSLPHVSKLTKGKITGVFHFDSKALVAEYIQEIGIPSTILLLGGFFNYIEFLLQPLPSTHPTGAGKKTYKISLPVPSSSSLPLHSVTEDTGLYVKAILLNPSASLGKEFNAGYGNYTFNEIIEIVRENGIDAVFEQCSDDAYRASMPEYPPLFVEDMVDNMKNVAENGFFPEGLDAGHVLLGEEKSKLQSFEDWVKAGGMASKQ